MMKWNIRVVETVSESGEVLRQFAEVFYDHGKPTGFGVPFLCWNPDAGEDGNTIYHGIETALAASVLRFPDDFAIASPKAAKGG